MSGTLSFVYSSVHGGLAAAYTSGALAAEFGPESVLVRLLDDGDDLTDAVIVESRLSDAIARRFDERLLAVVPDADGPCWALTTTDHALAQHADLVVRALSAVIAARLHRPPILANDLDLEYPGWSAAGPLQAAEILLLEDFVHGGTATVAA